MKKMFLPVVVAVVSVAGLAVADGAGNAYVSVDAPGARQQGGLDFAAEGNGDTTVVAVKAQPGWVLTSPAVQSIPKGSAGKWSARSFYGESSAGGEICIPTVNVSTNHVKSPSAELKIQVNEGNNHPGEKNDKGGDKERGGVINIAGSLHSLVPGLHRVTTVTDTCPGGESNKHSEDKKDVSVTPDTYKWSWSVGGQSGTSDKEVLLATDIKLPHGKYTITVSVVASSRVCPSCRYSGTATRAWNVGNGVINREVEP